MRAKKLLALIMTVIFALGMFADIPFSAAAPEERVEVIVAGEYSHIYTFDEQFGIYMIEKDGYAGLYSTANGWIADCKWYGIYETETDGFYEVYGEQGCGIIDAYGNEIIPATWDALWFDSGVVIVCDNGFCGLLDVNGNALTETIFDGIDCFYDGIAKIYKDEKVGFINTAGRVIVEPVWADAQDFSETVAAVKNENGLWGYIDTSGNTVIPCKYNNASRFVNGYASVLADDTIYVIDKGDNKKLLNGEPFMLEPVFDCMGYVDTVRFTGSEEDVACVKLKGEENYCYIDSSYNLITDSVYKYNVLFNNNDYAITVIPNRFGMEMYALLTIDRTNGIQIKTPLSGKRLIKAADFDGTVFFEAENRLYDINGNDLFGMDFEKYIYHYDGSDIINAVYNGQYVCVSFTGEVISPLSDYQFYYVEDNLYMATADDGRVKLCDRTGKQIAYTEEYAEAYVSDGVIYIKNTDGKWGICGTDGTVILEPQFDEVYGISEDMLKYKSKGKYGFYNMETGEIINPKFTRAGIFADGYCWVSEKVLIGAVDKNGNYIIDPLYWGHDDCTGFGGNEFVYKVTSVQKGKDGKYGVINDKGEKITDFCYDYISAFNDDGFAVFIIKDDNYNYNYGLMRVVHNDSEELPTAITTDKSEIVTYVGCHDIITETVTPSTAADLGVVYTSTNPAVATVDAVGRVYGVSEGNAIIVIASKATTSVIAAVSVKVEDRTLHAQTDIIPISAWEEQAWLSDVVIERLAELGIAKTAEQLTYGDLLEVNRIYIDEFPDTDPDKVYHIPAIIGEFSNLMSINICPEIFAPLISTMPDSAKFLSNLDSTYIYNTYGDEVDEDIVRNNESGMPDKNLYMAIGSPVRKYDAITDLSLENISDLTGLSLLDYEYESSINLSYNNITDISELEGMPFTDTVDLRYNKLDLNDENTLAVIESLEQNGCTVLTEGQNQNAVVFFEYYWDDSSNIDAPSAIRMPVYAENYNENYMRFFKIYGFESIDEISVTSADSDVATAYIEPYYGKKYALYCNPKGVGKTAFYLINKADGGVICSIPVTITDSRFFMEDIEVSYNVDEWHPFYAQLICENDYSYLQYRKIGESDWLDYCGEITENGIYEVRYISHGGMASDIAELNITGIKEQLTEEQMPDRNLRDYFGTVYEGYEVNSFYATYRNIHNLKGLSLLDFSNFSGGIYLNNNYITDITELARLDIKDIYIDLRYNRIDFTLPHNAAALRALYQKGCTVEIDSQFCNGVMTTGGYWSLDSDGGSFFSSINAYNAEQLTDISFSLRDGTVFTDLYSEYNIQNNTVYFGFDYTAANEMQYIDVLYKGEVVNTLIFEFYDNSEGLKKLGIYVSDYYDPEDGYEEYGFEVGFNNWGDAYEYRKQGDSAWITVSGWFIIPEAGIYEFRYMREDVYSDIATVELKTTVYNGLKMYLNRGGWYVYDCDPSVVPVDLVLPEAVDGYSIINISGISYCYNLKSLYIPKTVEQIGTFYGCSNLETVTISADNPNYYAVNNMIAEKTENNLFWIPSTLSDTVTIPEGIEKINLTHSNNQITKLILPASVKELNGLYELYALKEIEISAENPYLYTADNVIFERYTGRLIAFPSNRTGSYTIPDGILFICDYAFRDTDITEVTVPSSVLAIENSAFNDSSIATVKLSNGLLNIGEYAFSRTNIKEVYIPSSVTSIEYNAFYGCYYLEKLVIPPSVTVIGSGLLSSDYDTVIYCAENSYAHTYAVENGYNYAFITTGDLNGDGVINAVDLTELRRRLTQDREWAAGESALYDVNLDGEVDVRDMIRFKKYLAGYDVPLGSATESQTQTTALSAQPAYLDEKNTVI